MDEDQLQIIKQKAYELAEMGDYEQAAREIETLIHYYPEMDDIIKLHEKYEKASRVIGVPRGTSYYARGKRAALAEKDLEKAISLLYKSLNEEDYRENTVKELIPMLIEVKEYEEALRIIDSCRSSIKNERYIINIKESIYRRMRECGRGLDLQGIRYIRNEFENYLLSGDLEGCRQYISSQEALGFFNRGNHEICGNYYDLKSKQEEFHEKFKEKRGYDEAVEFCLQMLACNVNMSVSWEIMGDANLSISMNHNRSKYIKLAYFCYLNNATIANKEFVWRKFAQFCERNRYFIEACDAYYNILRMNPGSSRDFNNISRIINTNKCFVNTTLEDKDKANRVSSNLISVLSDVSASIDDYRPLRLKGELYEMQGDYLKAFEEYKNEMEIFPDDNRKVKLAIWTMEKGESFLQYSKEMLIELSKANPDDKVVDACSQICQKFMEGERLSEGIIKELLPFLRKVYPRVPGENELKVLQWKFMNKKPEQGVDVFDWLSRIYPKEWSVYKYYSNLLDSVGRSEEAYAAKKVVLEILSDPVNFDYYGRKTIYFCIKRDLPPRFDGFARARQVVDMYRQFTIEQNWNGFNKSKSYSKRKEDMERAVNLLHSLKDRIQGDEKKKFDDLCVLMENHTFEKAEKYLGEISGTHFIEYEELPGIFETFSKAKIMISLLKMCAASVTENRFKGSDMEKLIKILYRPLHESLMNICNFIEEGKLGSDELGEVITSFSNTNTYEPKSARRLLHNGMNSQNKHYRLVVLSLLISFFDRDMVSYELYRSIDNKLAWDDKINILNMCCEIYPQDIYCEELGKAYFEMGHFEKSIECFTRLGDKTALKKDYICANYIIMGIGIGELVFENYDHVNIINACHIISRSENACHNIDILCHMCRENNKYIYEKMLSGIKAEQIDDFREAFEQYSMMRSLEGEHPETLYLSAIKYLYERMSGHNEFKDVKCEIESTLSRMGYLAYEEAAASYDLNLSENSAEEDAEHCNKRDWGILEMQEDPDNTLNLLVKELKRIAPSIMGRLSSFNLDDRRLPSRRILEEIDRTIRSLTDSRELMNKMLSRAWMGYGMEDKIVMLESLVDYGVQAVRAEKEGFGHEMQGIYAYESLRIMNLMDSETRGKQTDYFLTNFISAAAYCENTKEILSWARNIKWIIENTVNSIGQRDIKKSYQEVYEGVFDIISLINRYESIFEPGSRLRCLNAVMDKISLLEQINVYLNGLKEAVQMLISRLKGILNMEIQRINNEPNIEVVFDNTSIGRERAIFLDLYNRGKGTARNVVVMINLTGDCEVKGDRFRNIGDIRGQDSKALRFDCITDSDGEINVEINIQYRNYKNIPGNCSSNIKVAVTSATEEFRTIVDNYNLRAVSESRDFYGRKELLRTIEDYIQRDIVIIHGLKRVGKTSILKQIYNVHSNDQDDFIPLVVSIQELQSESLGYFMYALFVQSIWDELEFKGYNVDLPHEEEFEKDSMVKVVRFLNNVKRKLKGKKILVMIDEFDLLIQWVARGDYSPDIFQFFKGIMQNRDELRFIIAGAEKLQENMRKYASPILEMSKPVEVGFLESEDIRNLIAGTQEGTKVKFSEGSIDEIVRLTKGHPYYAKIICSEIIRLLNTEKRYNVYRADVDRVVYDYVRSIRSYNNFDYLWEMLRNEPVAKLIIAIAAEGLNHREDTIKRSEVIQEVEGLVNLNRIVISDAVDLVRYRNLFVEDNDGRDESSYRFSIDLYRIWFKVNMPVDKVILEVDELC